MTCSPWQARGAAATSGLLLAAAFPPLNWWPLALVALLPLFLAVWGRHKTDPVLLGNALPETGDSSKLREESGGMDQGRDGHAVAAAKFPEDLGPRAGCFWPAFRLGWQFGFVFFTATLWWIQHVTLPGMLALTCYLALYPAVASGIAGWLGMPRGKGAAVGAGTLLLLAGVWTGLEWVRGVALSGFPWNGLAVPLFGSHSARILAAYIGVIGISGVVFLISLSAAAVIRLRGRKSATGLIRWASLLAVVELGFWFSSTRALQPGLEFHQAALVQTNLTMEQKMSPDPEVQRQRYFELEDQTRKTFADNKKSPIDLIVWPESAVPGYFNGMVQGGAFTELLGGGDFSLVTGADHEAWGKLYNSVAVMRGTTDNFALHPKIRLVPFGEFIPFRKEIPLLERMLGGLIPLDFTPGTSLEPMRVKDQPFSIVPLVCFEDTIGDHARLYIRAEPQVIVNVTNDNWFHQSPATEMHFVNARWRAAELRRTLVRSANTGVTAIVSPEGGIQRLPSFLQEVLTGWFHSGDRSITFYARHGNAASQVAGILALLGCGAVWWRRRRSLHAHGR